MITSDVVLRGVVRSTTTRGWHYMSPLILYTQGYLGRPNLEDTQPLPPRFLGFLRVLGALDTVSSRRGRRNFIAMKSRAHHLGVGLGRPATKPLLVLQPVSLSVLAPLNDIIHPPPPFLVNDRGVVRLA